SARRSATARFCSARSTRRRSGSTPTRRPGPSTARCNAARANDEVAGQIEFKAAGTAVAGHGGGRVGRGGPLLVCPAVLQRMGPNQGGPGESPENAVNISSCPGTDQQLPHQTGKT